MLSASESNVRLSKRRRAMSLLMLGLVVSVGLVIVPSVVFSIKEYMRRSITFGVTAYQLWRG